MEEFEQKIKKTIDLKNKIENEIDNINKLYDKTVNDLEKSFKMKYEQIKNKENEIKEKLDNEVTKVKENFENFLSKCDYYIKLSQKIKKGIEKFNKEEKNILKTLSYISKISEVKNEFNNLFKSKIESLNFYFEEKNSDINYKRYYFFNGILFESEMVFEYGPNCSLNIYWTKINAENINNNKIKYIIEMRKENEKIFEKIYEGYDNQCSTKNLNPNTFYEFKIRISSVEIGNEYEYIQKMKTAGIDFDVTSKILYESKRYDEFLKIILGWTGFKNMQLIYRGTRDGMTSNNFRNKCVNQGATITLIKNAKNNIFGGYASISWENRDIWANAPGSFLFTLTNIYNIKPTKFSSQNKGQEIGNFSYHGPNFGFEDIYFYSNFYEEGCSYSKFPKSYQDILGKGYSIFTGNSNNNVINLKEIEVFKLFN